MSAYTYTLPDNTVGANGNVILPAGNYRVQQAQITLIDGKEIHILLNRINVDTFILNQLTFIVSTEDLQLMSDSMTTGKKFSEELDDLIWGWVFAKEKAVVLVGRQLLPDEVLPETIKVA